MDYAIIGDSHECVTELRRLVTQLEHDIPNVQIVHVGDYVDKGQDTAKMVEYLYCRQKSQGDIILRGNHESFVHGRLIGELGALEDPVKEKLVFGSQGAFLRSPFLQKMFTSMWGHSYPYLRIESHFVTHAPCKKEHLGGSGSVSVREQRNYRTIDRTIPTVEDLNWFYEEADENDPLHIFGHMAHSGKTLEECQYKNKIFLDTGCVYGNGLSGLHLRDGKIAGYYFVPSEGNRQPHVTLPPPLGLR